MVIFLFGLEALFTRGCVLSAASPKQWDAICSLPRRWVQEIKRILSRFSHTWFIYNLNTISIRCEHTCTVIHIRTALLWIPLYWPIPPPCFPLCPFSTSCVSELPPFLLTWRSLFWWSWCECPSTLILGWWSTAYPLLPKPSPPSPPSNTHSSCYMFTETTSHQLHCLIHYWLAQSSYIMFLGWLWVRVSAQATDPAAPHRLSGHQLVPDLQHRVGNGPTDRNIHLKGF